MKRPIRKLKVPDTVVELIRNLHPHLKKKVKASLQAIVSDPYSGKPLKDELAGLRSFRVSRFRIIYRISGSEVYVLSVLDSRRNVEDILLNRLAYSK